MRSCRAKLNASSQMIKGNGQPNDVTQKRVQDLHNQMCELNLCVFTLISARPLSQSIYTIPEIPAMSQSAAEVVTSIIRVL